MSDTWYYADQNKQVGPLDIQQLKASLARIANAKDVLVWHPGFTDWKRAGDVPELSTDMSAPPLPFAERPAPFAPAGAELPAVQPTVLQLWFSFSGRINRAKYWLVSLINLAILLTAVGAMILQTALGAGFVANASLTWLLVGLIVLTTMISSYAVAAKRLHDRDKSAWWIVAYYVVPGIISAAVGPSGSQGTVLIASLISFLIYLAVFIDLGCLRGTIGDNRFGPDPLAGRS